jgi:hypothetical protein
MTSMPNLFLSPSPDPESGPGASPNTQHGLLAKAYSPFLQAGAAGGMVILLLLITLPLKHVGPGGFSERLPWIIVTAFMLLFALFNSMIGLASLNSIRYWNQSVVSYMLLASIGGLLAWWSSGVPIHEAGSFRWLFFVVSFSYLVFISIVNLMRAIVAFAMKEEWSAPRQRDRRRRRS